MNFTLLTSNILDAADEMASEIQQVEQQAFDYNEFTNYISNAWTSYWDGNKSDIIEKGAQAALNVAERFTDYSMGFVKELIFSGYSGVSGAFALIHSIAGAAALIALIILASYKGIQAMINNASGGDYTPPLQVIMDVVKSCIYAVSIPWLMVLILGILPSLGKLIYYDGVVAMFPSTTVWDKFVSGNVVEYKEASETITLYFNPTYWLFTIFMEFCLWLGNICFMAKMCKFQVEVMFLDATALIAAIDSSTTKKDFYENWTQTFKALLITNIANTAFYSLAQSCYYTLRSSGTTVMCFEAVFAIGAALCLIRGTIFTNKYKSGGFMGSAVSGVANAARSATMMIPKI